MTAHRKILLLTVSILCIFFSERPAVANGIEKRVNQLLTMAMTARDNSNQDLAELYFLQAKKLSPNLSRPRWLKPQSAYQSTDSNDQRYLELIKAVDYSLASSLLNESLSLKPDNQNIRELYLELARKNADHAQVKRHESFLGIKAFDYQTPVILILLILIAIQTVLIIKRRKAPDTKMK